MATGSRLTAQHRRREALAIFLTLLITAGAIGGGYWLATRNDARLSGLIPHAQPTPPPTLQPLIALTDIQKLVYPARVSFASPLTDETDLITTNSGGNATYTPTFAANILSLYMRGYPKQTFWRWLDQYPTASNVVIYEVHRGELWVISASTTVCDYTWTVYTITPDQIIQRGVSGRDYSTGIAAHPGTGSPPSSVPACGP
jgi:hypothetical protein